MEEKEKPTGFESTDVWLDCTLIYDPVNQLAANLRDMKELTKAVNHFEKMIKKHPKNNLWYDNIDCKVFGIDLNWMNSSTTESSFISPTDQFIYSNNKVCNSKTPWDIRYVMNYYGKHFGKDMVCNEEIIYQNNPRIHKFKNSKILVIAGGPSAKEVDWDPDDYDYIFSCNHFYLNDKLKNTNVDFSIIGGEIDMSKNNKEFHDYMKKNNTLLCFEDRMSKQASEYFKKMKNKYKDRCFYAHPRYRGKPGAGLRLLLYACFFGAKEIHFVGIDGMRPNTKKGDLHNHAFQKNKKYSHKALDFGVYRRHYVMFWDYVINCLKLHKSIKFQNLGEGHEANQTTTISKHFFPLEIKNGFN